MTVVNVKAFSSKCTNQDDISATKRSDCIEKNATSITKENNKVDDKELTLCVRATYGFGNVLNDLCATLWFTYLLVYLNFVAQLNSQLTGYLMLAGQIADAVATILLGFITDKTCASSRYGKRKIWHLIGCLAVSAVFPFLFNVCFLCESMPNAEARDWLRFGYYFIFIVIFQFGWATNQVSHLALIPELASKQSDRIGLSSIRHAFTVVSSVTVYGMVFLLLGLNGNTDDELSPNEQPIFMILSLTTVGIGAVFTFIFHMVIKETTYKDDVSLGYPSKDEECFPNDSRKKGSDMKWLSWLKEHQLYQIGILYTFTRVVVISSQVYIPFFISSSLHMEQQYIAIIPLIIYACSFLTALIMKPVNHFFGAKLTYFLGATIVMCSCAWMWFITEESAFQVIGAAVLLGIGTSALYVTSLGIIANLIGENSATGGFVYGLMSFSEKLVNGGVVAMIQFLYPCMTATCCGACVLFYKQVIAFVPGGSALLAMLTLLTLLPFSIGKLRYHKSIQPVEIEKAPGDI